MGNQLAGIAPSQIYPVEHYLTELPEFQFDASLGSTRFFKVAKAKYREGPIVVKVFVIHDPTLPLKSYKDQLEECKHRLYRAPNCLAFKRFMLTEKAGLLFRQFVKDNLYDRISTRPFLNNVEKKWIAFQIICAVNQCHRVGICHGDIKLENLMVTGWNWLMLTDFASFKPTYLPEDNPADFSFFFDTSRRRTCYIAPERFVKTFNPDTAVDAAAAPLVLPDDEFRKGDLTPAMDIFSVGCVLIELFTEGSSPFDFSQLLSYRSGEYDPCKTLEKIEDENIRELVQHMIQKDPTKRFSAERYLEQQRGKAFPVYFYSFLLKYMQRFSSAPMAPPDDNVARLRKDLTNIITILGNASVDKEETAAVTNSKNIEGLIIIVSLVTSYLRSVKHCTGKIHVLEILGQLTHHLSDEIILDRLVPYMLCSVNDPFPQVRVAAIEVLTTSLTLVKNVPKSDANIFPEYILPQLASKAHDESVLVRVTFAKHIATLSETSLRFLELSQIENPNVETNEESHLHYQASYDNELQTLHDLLQQTVSALLTDPDNIVKRTLLDSGVTPLCVFFGRRKANDILLSHMITVLNDKEDRHLRGAFFDAIVGVATYIGWQNSPILKPLLQQGLSDAEEFVTNQTLRTMSYLVELGLFQKHILYELLGDAVPLLCHPNNWIRHDAVGFICTAARTLNVADVHCKLLTLLRPYLRRTVLQLDKEVIVLDALVEPIPHAIFDDIVRTQGATPPNRPVIADLLDSLAERQLLRQQSPALAQLGQPQSLVMSDQDPALRMLYRRLVSDGLTPAVEDKILRMRDYLIKLHKAKTRQDNVMSSNYEMDGRVDLGSERLAGCRRYCVDLGSAERRHDPINQLSKNAARQKQVLESPMMGAGMNEEWQHMFGTPADPVLSPSPKSDQPTSATVPGESDTTESRRSSSLPPQLATAADDVAEVQPTAKQPPARLAHAAYVQQQTSLESQPSPVVRAASVEQTMPLPDSNIVQDQYADCKLELMDLIQKKVSEHSNRMLSRKTVESGTWDAKQPPSQWRPKGILVAHLHEHRSAVNRILVIPNTTLFASCSNDGTVKIWDCDKMEKRSISNRSRQTYSRQDSQISSMAYCPNLQSLACASDNGSIHVFRIETTNSKMATTSSRNLDPQEEGCVVDMSYFDTGSQNVIVYATMYGSIVGWDLRSPGTAWKLENDYKHGLLTSLCVDPRQSWLAAGTSTGAHVCWDMRFRLPISTITNKTQSRVRRLTTHPTQQSWVVSSVQDNNEVSMWDMETLSRTMTVWASPAPPFSSVQVETKTKEVPPPSASCHSTCCFHVSARDGCHSMITAGTDSRIRFWDLKNSTNSYIVSGAANDRLTTNLVSYSSQVIDGTEVLKETVNTPQPVGEKSNSRRGSDAPPSGHLDIISDLAVYQTTQWLLVTASRDGIIKVWK